MRRLMRKRNAFRFLFCSMIVLVMMTVTGVAASVSAACNDHSKNQDETDIDCGGSCADCATGKTCLTSADCQSSYCDGSICRETGSTTTTVSTAVSTCTDSDGGENYFVRGSAQGFNHYNNAVVTWSDYCTDTSGRSLNEGPVLYEAVCRNNEVVYLYNVPCENGCKQGACQEVTSKIKTIESLESTAYTMPEEERGLKESNVVRILANQKKEGMFKEEISKEGISNQEMIKVTHLNQITRETPIMEKVPIAAIVQNEDKKIFTNVAEKMGALFVEPMQKKTTVKLPAGVSERSGLSEGTVCSQIGAEISGVDLCNGLEGLRRAISALRNEFLPRIEDLENEISRMRDEEIKQQLTHFFNSCERNWDVPHSGEIKRYSDDNLHLSALEQLGYESCTEYCRGGEGKVCQYSVVPEIVGRDRSIGSYSATDTLLDCGIQISNTDIISGSRHTGIVACVCCDASIPS